MALLCGPTQSIALQCNNVRKSQCNRRRKSLFCFKAGVTTQECPIHPHSCSPMFEWKVECWFIIFALLEQSVQYNTFKKFPLKSLLFEKYVLAVAYYNSTLFLVTHYWAGFQTSVASRLASLSLLNFQFSLVEEIVCTPLGRLKEWIHIHWLPNLTYDRFFWISKLKYHFFRGF